MPAVASALVCPAGFVEVTNGSVALGCMAEEEAQLSGPPSVSFVTWRQAADACFDLYGGRLPSQDEIYVAFENVTLTELDINDFEFVGSVNDDYRPFDDTFTGGASTHSFRCWLPADVVQGAAVPWMPWVAFGLASTLVWTGRRALLARSSR